MFDQEIEYSQAENVEEAETTHFNPNVILDIQSLKEIEKLLEDVPNSNIVLDFWAEWCGPCKAFSPVFEELHRNFSDDFIFAKVNVGKDDRISYRYKITSIPTYMIIKNGTLAYKRAGTVDYSRLKELLERYRSFRYSI
ncbi:hypothetical protein LCGC14_0934300 [marine sediment metagenome]|uniref:Thioredoxin domain-containing protein n=1 Tax=marine sediment metagenome TaxID=412755 RepID=A0A0F9RTI4_9ZZZZ|nr:MAG: Thioredoxin-1 [Candidatus Lokiarchaeum sp. GC14_75]